jgi:hypothetical protein
MAVGMVSITLLSFQSSAVASSMRITKGDAQAVFEASFTGGGDVILHNNSIENKAAPADSAARIRPVFDGLSYCSLDWHVISFALLFPASTEKQARNAFASSSVTFLLDGSPISSTQTAMKRDTSFEAEVPGTTPSWVVHYGQVVAPADLAVGTHTLEADVTTLGFTDQFGPVSFTIDPAGTGACL